MKNTSDFVLFAVNQKIFRNDKSTYVHFEKTWKHVDDFLASKQDCLSYVQDHYLSQSNYTGSMEVAAELFKSFILNMLLHRFDDRTLVDELFYDIANSPKRGFESYLLSDAFEFMSEGYSLVRDTKGALYPADFFKKIQSKNNLNALLKSCISHDDGDAILFLKKIPFYAKSLVGKDLERALKGLDINPDSKVYRALMDVDLEGDVSVDPFTYLSILSAMDKSYTRELALKMYDASLSEKYAHPFMSFCMQKWSIKKSPGQLSLITQMVEDGGDWYLAYKQATVSPSVYLDLAHREKRPVEELREMLTSFAEFPALTRNVLVIDHIVMGLPESIKKEAIKDKSMSALFSRHLKRISKLREETVLEA